MESISMPISINCEVLPDQEQPDANPDQQDQQQQPLLSELPFQMDAEAVPEEEELYQNLYQRLVAEGALYKSFYYKLVGDNELYQNFYQRLANDLAKEIACSCEGSHDD